MRALVGTWDGAGNLPPILALIEALVDRGHDVQVVCHDIQSEQVIAAGATFHPYRTVPQWDVGLPGWLGGDSGSFFTKLNEASGVDISEAADHLKPDVALIDCMLPRSLMLTQRAGFKTVALVHAVYSFFGAFGGGSCKGPIDDADLAPGMTYAAFDQGTVFPPNLEFVGPLRPSIGVAPRRQRAPDKSFVLVSLSTGYQAPGQLDLLQRVCDAVGSLDVEALVTTGRGIAPEALSVGANIVAERSVPHDAVLPGADLLVTHAGHGTVMAGLRYGVPMLCLPPMADQPFNARKVEALGLGAVLDPAASVEEIRSAISQLLVDEHLKSRARSFSAEVAAEPGVAKAVELLEALVA
jgi:UDP:flavonoid glycosyltransferase YjiC (YdhE family)